MNTLLKPNTIFAKLWFTPCITLLISLLAILYNQVNTKGLLTIFWYEIIIVSTLTCVRILFALNGSYFFQNLIYRIALVGAAAFLSWFMVILGVILTVFLVKEDKDGIAFNPSQVHSQVVAIAIILGLHTSIYYFMQRRYLHANPLTEAVPIIRCGLIIGIIAVVYKLVVEVDVEANQPMIIVISIAVAKCVIDLAFALIAARFSSTKDYSNTSIQ